MAAQYQWTAFETAQAATFLLLGLLLTPAGAHFFELFSKARLSPQDYYAGWALLAF